MRLPKRRIIMNHMKRFESLSFKNRLALSFTVVLALMLILAALFYLLSYRRLERSLSLQAASDLSASIRQTDHLLEQVNAAGMQLSTSTLFKALSDSDGAEKSSFSYAAWQVQQELSYILPPKQLLMDGSLFIYMKNSGYLLSSSFFSELALMQKYSTSYAELSKGELAKGLMSPDHWRRFLPLGDGTEPPESYLYLCPINSSLLSLDESAVDSLLCLQISASSLASLFPQLDNSSDFLLYAADSGGNETLSLPGAAYTGLDGEKLEALAYRDGSAAFTADRRQMSSSFAVSEYNSWRYYLARPSSEVYYSAESYQRLALLIMAAAAVLECGFILFLITCNSRPVDRLSSELASQTSLATSLSSMVERTRPLVSETYTRRLMEGRITTNEQMAQIIGELGLNREGCRYQALCAQVAPRHAQDLNADDLKLCIQNYDILVRDALRRYFPDTGYLYKPGDAVFACLIALPSSGSDEECTAANVTRFQQLHQELLDRYDIEISGGFGSVRQIASYIWKSYQEARNARSLSTSDHYVVSCYELSSATDEYYFPESLAVQLSGFISTGSREQVEEVFHQLKEENLCRRSLSHTQLRWLISDVRGTVFRKRRAIDPALIDTREKAERLDLIDRRFEGEISLDTLESISLQLCSFYGSGSESNELIVRIQEYINANYADPSLSLSKISEEFHISENYFSFLFKKEVSENFSTYLEKLRMAKAKELVMESAASISELYQYTGYNNAASFRRVFKKTFGVSPKEMRDKAADPS